MKEYKVEINKKKNNLCDLRELIGRGWLVSILVIGTSILTFGSTLLMMVRYINGNLGERSGLVSFFISISSFLVGETILDYKDEYSENALITFNYIICTLVSAVFGIIIFRI